MTVKCPGEEKSSFVKRYVTSEHVKQRFPDRKQRLAVALSTYSESELTPAACGLVLMELKMPPQGVKVFPSRSTQKEKLQKRLANKPFGTTLRSARKLALQNKGKLALAAGGTVYAGLFADAIRRSLNKRKVKESELLELERIQRAKKAVGAGVVGAGVGAGVGAAMAHSANREIRKTNTATIARNSAIGQETAAMNRVAQNDPTKVKAAQDFAKRQAKRQKPLSPLKKLGKASRRGAVVGGLSFALLRALANKEVGQGGRR